MADGHHDVRATRPVAQKNGGKRRILGHPWVRALHRLDFKVLPDDPHALAGTLACLLKTREDRFQLGEERVRQLIEGRRTVGVAEKAPQTDVSA